MLREAVGERMPGILQAMAGGQHIVGGVDVVARSEVVTVEVAGGVRQWDAEDQPRCPPNLERKGLTHANLIFLFLGRI